MRSTAERRARRLVTVVVGIVVLCAAPAASADNWQWATSYQLTGTGWGSPMSCPTTTLCVTSAEVNSAQGIEDDVMWSSDPTGGASTWHYVALESAAVQGTYEPISGVSCVPPPTSGSAIVCALVDGLGNFWETSDPTTTSASDWTESTPGSYGFEGVSCWSDDDCGAIDSGGNALGMVGLTAANDVNVFSGGPFDAGQLDISCNSAPFCAASDDGSSVAWSSSPVSGSPGWQTATLAGVSEVEQVSCPASTLCVAAELSGISGASAVGVSTNPTGGAGAWTSTALPAATHPVVSVTCPSTTLCLLGSYDEVFSSTDPTGGASTWQSSTVPFDSNVGDITCPTTTECLAYQNGEISVGTLTAGGGTGGGGGGGGSGGAGGQPGGGTTTVGHAAASGTTVALPVSCAGASGATCVITASLSAEVTSRGSTVLAVTARSGKKPKKTKKEVQLGTASVTIAAGRSATLTIRLSAEGKRLLTKRHTLPTKLTVSHTSGGKTVVLTTSTVTFKTKAKKRS